MYRKVPIMYLPFCIGTNKNFYENDHPIPLITPSFILVAIHKIFIIEAHHSQYHHSYWWKISPNYAGKIQNAQDVFQVNQMYCRVGAVAVVAIVGNFPSMLEGHSESNSLHTFATCTTCLATELQLTFKSFSILNLCTFKICRRCEDSFIPNCKLIVIVRSRDLCQHNNLYT